MPDPQDDHEDDQVREFVRNLFADDPDENPTGNFTPAPRPSVEDVRPDNPDTPERNFVRALFTPDED